jgi:intracellular sulfur oxidation DsrE/DsrF family protein
MSINRRFQLFSMAAGLFAAGAARASDTGGFKVVYHLSDGIPQAGRAIGNIRNHLAAEPKTKIVVVTHGAGIDFLLDGAESAPGQPFAGAISDLASSGVEFRVCNNTLVARKINADRVVMEAKIVPSGVAEVTKLQAREGFVYLKP